MSDQAFTYALVAIMVIVTLLMVIRLLRAGQPAGAVGFVLLLVGFGLDPVQKLSGLVVIPGDLTSLVLVCVLAGFALIGSSYGTRSGGPPSPPPSGGK